MSAAAAPLLVTIDAKVYDLTKFAAFHPGGRAALERVGGTDATEQFRALHKPSVLEKYAHLATAATADAAASESADAARSRKCRVDHCEPGTKFGATDVLYAEPYWYYGLPQPYYNESHAKLRRYVRAWVTEHFSEAAINAMEDEGSVPPALTAAAAKAGLFHLNCRYCLQPLVKAGLLPAPELPDGLDFSAFDDFHDLIVVDELARCAAGGVLAGLFVSLAISLPCILMAGSEELKGRVVADALAGRKRMCLAITEPYGGSDVAGVRTTAVRDAATGEYVVSGEKKFITGGCVADFFVVAVRTGDEGYFGISLLLLEKGMAGIQARRMKTQGWASSNTAFLTFDRVRVPAANLIGEEDAGFMTIMHQFNHERMFGVLSSNRFARACLEDAMRFIRVRETFGKRLADHQVIAFKVAEMVRRVEGIHAHLEQLTYQMKMGATEAELMGPIALLKVAATKELEFVVREASQCLGGNSCIRGAGFGARIERIYREVRVNAIGGGSEEIMLELFAKTARL